MAVRPLLAALVALTTLLVAGCSDDEPVSGSASQVQPDDDPAEPAGETEDDGADGASDTDDPGGIDTGGVPDVSGSDCDADVTVTGAVTGTLRGGTGLTNDAAGPKAFYQALGEDLLLSAYSEGEGVDASVILQVGSETYGTDPGAAGLDIAEDGSGFTVDTEVTLVPSGEKTAQVTGSMSC